MSIPMIVRVPATLAERSASPTIYFPELLAAADKAAILCLDWELFSTDAARPAWEQTFSSMAALANVVRYLRNVCSRACFIAVSS